jgi:electron transfer flavoprotein alpha subunit
LTTGIIIIGTEVKELAKEIAEKTGLNVTAVRAADMNTYSGELYSGVLAEFLARNPPKYVCAANSAQGLDYAPAIAAKFSAACITGVEDIITHKEQLCFARSLFGGKLVAGVLPTSETTILTIQPGAFLPGEEPVSTPGAVTVESTRFKPRRSRPLEIKQSETDSSGIKEANVIVAAGQGIGGKDNLDLIRQLASVFTKSAIAGSRIVCDLGWLEYKCQVGVTGATVSPRLYIACGISGAIQHLAGMRGSEFIVAINKDPAAAIFQLADICIVEDLFTFIPAFIDMYQKKHCDSPGDCK